MRKSILTCLLLLCAFGLRAQSQPYPWYDQSRELTGEGFSYQCDNPYGGLVDLYRTTSIHVDEEPIYRIGVPIPYVGYNESPALAEPPHGLLLTIDSLFRSVLTPTQYMLIRDDKILISFVLNTDAGPDGGKVTEMQFTMFPTPSHFSNRYGFIAISPEQFNQIENELRKLRFTITDFGRECTFARVVCRYLPIRYENRQM